MYGTLIIKWYVPVKDLECGTLQYIIPLDLPIDLNMQIIGVEIQKIY